MIIMLTYSVRWIIKKLSRRLRSGPDKGLRDWSLEPTLLILFIGILLFFFVLGFPCLLLG